MKLDDITVEVRDKALNRVGVIRPEDLDLEIDEVFNNVGTWKLRVAVEHRLAGLLRTPGAGVIVTGPDGTTLMSGPIVTPQSEATVTDPRGTLTITGVTDTVLLADVLCYPDPSNGDPTTQTILADVRPGPVETIMHGFVAANIGPSAPTVRRPAGTLLSKVTLGPNGARGPVTSKSARFNVLGDLLFDLAATADLGFRMIQRGSNIVFETYPVRDRSAVIRLDIWNSTLSGHKVATAPPGVTRVLVAGQYQGLKRQFVLRTNDAATAAETQWGRRIERFLDQRNTTKVDELKQAGDEALATSGFSQLGVQAVPMEDSSMPFPQTWFMGDHVTVVVEGQELSSTVTGYILKANSAGFRVGAVLGDTSGFNPRDTLSKRVSSVESRIAVLEREGTPSTDDLASTAYVDGAIGEVQNIVTAVQNTVSSNSGQLSRLPKVMTAGIATVTPVPNTATSQHIVFPDGLFTTTPVITVTAQTSAPGTVVVGVSSNSPSPAGFDVVLYRTNTVVTTIHWIAVQT